VASSAESIATQALEHGRGIVRLAPNWVPRVFCVPGRRLKLHPDDYYALGGNRGGIDERWFASTIRADNGPLTGEFEGLSFVVGPDGSRVLLADAVAALKGELVGERIWSEYGEWPMYAKFFDNQGPLPFHIHHREEHARLIGRHGKPEAYYFPPQVNNHGGDFPHTYFGLNPGTTKEQLRACLEAFPSGDNRINTLSRAYRLLPGTGWDVPGGVLHAPGSMCTYEPQKASDVFSMFESLNATQVIPEDLLWKDVPEDRKGDIDFLVELVDWEKNVDPDFATSRFLKPRPVRDEAEMKAEGYVEKWITYRSTEFSAKELTVAPGRTVTVKDAAAYGLIVLQGHGTLGGSPIETPALIRFGELTRDEYFVSERAACQGVAISNPSDCDPIVMLKHFGPRNPDLGL